MLETLFGCVVAMFGILVVAGPFRDISLSTELFNKLRFTVFFSKSSFGGSWQWANLLGVFVLCGE